MAVHKTSKWLSTKMNGQSFNHDQSPYSSFLSLTVEYLKEVETVETRLQKKFSLWKIFNTINKSRTSCRVDHIKWLKETRDQNLKTIENWGITQNTSVLNYISIITQYAHIASWILENLLEGKEFSEMYIESKYAESIELFFWLYNKNPFFSIDSILMQTDSRLIEMIEGGLAPKILPILPKPYLSVDIFIAQRLSKANFDETSLSEKNFKISDEMAKAFWATSFDVERIQRYSNQEFIPNPEKTWEIREEAIKKIKKLKPEKEFWNLLDLHDSLVLLNTYAEPRWGFKGWPGVLFSALRQSFDTT